MKFLILAHRWDASAAKVAVALSRRHPTDECRLVTVEELLFAPSWRHHVGTGPTRSEVTLRDGLVLRSEETGVVLNRLTSFDLPHFGGPDRAYAVSEMSALLVSWLEGFPRSAVNPVTPRSFCSGYTRVRWLALAAEAGLPLPRLLLTSNLRRFPANGLPRIETSPFDGAVPFTSNESAFLSDAVGPVCRSILIAGDEMSGELPADMVSACRTLARLAATPIVRFHFNVSVEPRSRWTFSHAETLPDLVGNDVDVVVRFLERIVAQQPSLAFVA